MTDLELREHLEFLDGIQKAQMLALRLVLREQPSLKMALHQYAEELNCNPIAKELTAIQLESMKKYLLGVSS